MDVVKEGSTVLIDYTGKLDDGTVFDTSIEASAQDAGIKDDNRNYEPIEFKVGDHQVIKGFEEAVVGMKKGDSKTVTIDADQAYGQPRKELVVEVDTKEINSAAGHEIKEGDVVSAPNNMRGVVKSMSEEKTTIDFNHPLAGKTLNFDLTVVDVR